MRRVTVTQTIWWLMQVGAISTSVLGLFVCSAIETRGQSGSETIRQIPAPLPKLAVNDGGGQQTGKTQHQRVSFAITNWDRYPGEMFVVPAGHKLPPNPCGSVSSRVLLTVYSNKGSLISSCIAAPRSIDLARFTVLIPKGKTAPEFLYVVITDRYTGAAYRSNLVSPWSGLTK